MTPDRGCDHTDGSPMGVCAICGKTVCSECYTTVFNEMICDEHEALEDESAWELVAIYTDPAVVADNVQPSGNNGSLLHHIAMKLKRRLRWVPDRERFAGDDDANGMLARPQRPPWPARPARSSW